VDPIFKGKDHASQFANSLHYADQAVYDFIQQCKKQPWWDNTVIVIIADHGHGLLEPSNWMENFKIPMLWLGGALDTTGMEVNKVASQIDLATTLVKQAGASQHLFPFSKNIFDSTVRPWAYFSFNNGFGFVQPQQQFVFDNVGKQLILQKGNLSEIDIKAGKAMQQFTFQDYVDK
jgi:phosphoglycerol transferase MdoB-like AlkP superfamily enzyme